MAVKIDHDKCIYCGACVATCPYLALRLKEVYVEVLPDKCVDCKLCIKACPVGCISLPDDGEKRE